jgi:hypothetical protein
MEKVALFGNPIAAMAMEEEPDVQAPSQLCVPIPAMMTRMIIAAVGIAHRLADLDLARSGTQSRHRPQP